MNKLKTNLAVAAALAVLAVIGTTMNSQHATAQPPGPPDGLAVRLVSPLPLPVSISGTPARQPFQTTLNSQTFNFSVDPNKTLTIEFVSSICTAPAPAFSGLNFQIGTQLTTGSPQVRHNFESGFLSPSGASSFLYGSTDMTRIYAGPGTTVALAVTPCSVSLSGYTETN